MPGQLSLFKGKKQRGTKPPPVAEFVLQCMVADILRRWATPGWQWTHFPAGELRDFKFDKRGRRYSPTGLRLKRMGTQPGWPDFILLAPAQVITSEDGDDAACIGRAYFLELKRRGNTLSDAQHAFMEWCAHHGYEYRWVNNFDDAVHWLKQWGALRATVSA